jgi:hypothetical protein
VVHDYFPEDKLMRLRQRLAGGERYSSYQSLRHSGLRDQIARLVTGRFRAVFVGVRQFRYTPCSCS